MPRSGWIAIGATVGALALPGAGRPAAALLLALAGLLLVALPRLTRRRRVAALAAMLGAATVALRLAIGGPPAGLAGEVGPDGTGPWTMVVETVGAPREGRQVATLRSVGHGVAGPRLAATLPRYPSVEPGDTVVVEGRARPRPDTPYGDYLERIGAWGTLQARRLEVASVPGADAGRTLERLRRGAGDVLAAVLPEPEAGLAAGILIGLRDRVDRDVAAAFTTAGVSHVVAISGWNIAIVAAAVAALAGRIDRRRRAVVTAAAIAVYIVFAGASPSVLRAGAMAGVVLLARESGRAGLAAAALGWAAALLLVAEPGLVSDAGFQLSTLATAGLIVWASPLTERIDRWTRGGLPRWLSESLGVSLAAQAATLPVVLASFGRLAVIAPVVNLLVVPLVAPVMVAGVVAFAGGLLVVLGAPGGLGAILAAPGWVGLRLMVGIVETAAVVPFASVSVPPSVAVPMAAMLVGVAAIVRLASRRWRARPRGGGSAIAASAGVASNRRYDNVSASTRRADRGTLTARRVSVGLLVVTVGLTGAVVVSRPAGVARIAVLDVGQGDAILVEGARSGRLLVDGGPDPDRLLIELDRRIPPWDRRIDAVVLTHPHEDHVAGLVLLLDRYRVETVFEPGMRGPGPGYAAWQARLARPDGPRRLGLAAGDRLRVDDIAIRVLWPDRGDVPTEPPSDGSMINRVSIVLLGTVADHRFLLTGDIEEDVDPVLLSRGLPKIDVLKIAHHGSRTATTEPFVAATRPAIAIASTGAENTYGHPARATLDRLTAVGARVYRTDLDGTVTATFDAAGIGVRRQPRANAADAAGPAVGEGGSLRYHRRDDGPFADGRRRPAVLPGPAGLARQARARRGRGRRVPRAADRRTRDPAGPTRGRGSRPAPRRRQDPARGRSCPRAPPWGGIRGLARPARSSRARPDRRRPSGLAPARRGDPAPLVRVREPRGARGGLRGQTRAAADRLDGRALRDLGAPPSRDVGRGDHTVGAGPCGPPRDRGLPRSWHPPRGGPAPGLDGSGTPGRPPRHRRVMVPLLYLWGDDDLVASRRIDRLASTLADESGAPPERWEVRGELANAASQVAQLHERLATPAMFGGGTLAVVTNPGALVRRNDTRDTLLEAIALLAAGNALVIVEATKSDTKARRAPGQKRLSDAIRAAGGNVDPAFAPPPQRLSAWIEEEARDRGLALDPGAARELGERLGSRVTEGDVERRHLTRVASTELDKLALRHAVDGGPVSADDVQALVALATPASVWALTDAVGERRRERALAALDRLIDTTPEPVVLAALHKRVRDLLEVGDRFAAGQKPPEVVAATGLHPFVAEKMQTQARHWTTDELRAALEGLLELDAMVKGAPGSETDTAQRRLAFTLWVEDHAGGSVVNPARR